MSDDFVTIDRLLGELRHRYRRQILTFVEESDSETTHLDDLVEYLENRNDEPPASRRLTVILHHSALPALADAGLVEYDSQTNTVRNRDGSRLESALDLLDEVREGTSWSC